MNKTQILAQQQYIYIYIYNQSRTLPLCYHSYFHIKFHIK